MPEATTRGYLINIYYPSPDEQSSNTAVSTSWGKDVTTSYSAATATESLASPQTTLTYSSDLRTSPGTIHLLPTWCGILPVATHRSGSLCTMTAIGLLDHLCYSSVVSSCPQEYVLCNPYQRFKKNIRSGLFTSKRANLRDTSQITHPIGKVTPNSTTRTTVHFSFASRSS